MAEQWYYRMFGQDFGPVTFEELKQLAELGSISSDDEVRMSDVSNWTTAGSVAALGLSATVNRGAVADAPSQNGPAGANDWYYMLQGREKGPIGFDNIVALAEQGKLEASDEVKLGATGKWRRVGSIGRLVAVLPYHAPAIPEPMPIRDKPRSKAAIDTVQPTPPKSSPSAVAQEIRPVIDEGLIQAQATYAATDQAARSLVSWALAPNVDPAWWCWIGGAERGPIGFVQIYDWTIAGQLQGTDFVKNGMYGQYVHAANVPGLFNAVSLVAPARQALDIAKATAEANAVRAAKSAPVVNVVVPPVAIPLAVQANPEQKASAAPVPSAASSPVRKSSATLTAVPEPVAPQKTVAPPPAIEIRPPQPDPVPIAPRPTSSNFNTPQAAAARPVTAPSRPSIPARKSADSSTFDAIKDPKVLGGIGAAAALVLLYFGSQYIPFGSGKDLEIYQQAMAIVVDVRAARASNSTDFAQFKTRVDQLKDKYVPKLKEEASSARPAKQALLFAIRDELPRMMSSNLSEESPPEKNAVAHLRDAAKYLGVK